MMRALTDSQVPGFLLIAAVSRLWLCQHLHDIPKALRPGSLLRDSPSV